MLEISRKSNLPSFKPSNYRFWNWQSLSLDHRFPWIQRWDEIQSQFQTSWLEILMVGRGITGCWLFRRFWGIMVQCNILYCNPMISRPNHFQFASRIKLTIGNWWQGQSRRKSLHFKEWNIKGLGLKCDICDVPWKYERGLRSTFRESIAGRKLDGEW